MVKTTSGTEILALILIIVFCNFFNSANCNKLNRTIREPKPWNFGEPGERSQFPFLALIQPYGSPSKQTVDNTYFGVIISDSHVLARDSDVRGIPAASLQVIVGNTYFNDWNVTKRVLRTYIPPYGEPYRDNIALLQINGSFEPWTKLIQPIKLKTDQTTSGDCVVSEFGRTTENEVYKLRFLKISIMPWQTCKEIAESKYGRELQDNLICSRDGLCDGVPGGILVCSGKLAGLKAWRGNCGDINAYAVVAKYVQFIKDNDSLCARLRAVSAPTSLASFSAQSSPFLNLISLLIILFIGKFFRNVK